MNNLSDINSWKQDFGLLPILLNPNFVDNKFLMLNGGSGDFCLQTNNIIEDPSAYFNISWSTNTKNFIAIDNDYVHLSNWFDKKIEKIPINKIASNSEQFYKYLISKSYKTESDVVPFVLDVFRKLRNVTYEKEKPTDALNLLFKLLISIEDDYTKIDYAKWGIEDVGLPSQFEYFVDLIRQGVKSINPNLDLILRHSSGSLFQEAHREVIYFNPQRDLFGGVSSNLVTKNDAYSSIHYTPQYLARTIVENSLKELLPFKNTIKIFDPSCGSSEFLIEALKQLKNIGFNGQVKVVGWDTSESAVSASKFLLQYEKRTQWSNLEFEVKLVNDSLTENWENDYDLILMNPPFISWELLTNRESKDAILETLGLTFKNGKPNQASAFFYKASKSLKINGVIGCVLPSSIFTFDSYLRLRNDINADLNIKIVAKLGNFVFEDALTDVSFFVGKKEVASTKPKLIWTKNEKGVVQDVLRDLRKMSTNNEQTLEEKNYSIYTPSDFPVIKDSWKTISLTESKLIKEILIFLKAGRLVKIGEIFSVKLGIRTGNNNVFKLTPEKYSLLPQTEKKYFKSVIDNGSIKNGSLLPINYSWYPYNIKDGSSLINDEEYLKIAVPYFYENHLKDKKNELINRKKKTANWWDLSDRAPRLLPLTKSLVSTEFGNSNSFAINNNNSIVERGYLWDSKFNFEQNDYYFYLALFSSNTFDKLLSIYTKQLAGGNWYDLGKSYTTNIPIPNVNDQTIKQSKAYQKLVEFGEEVEKGNSFVKPLIDDILTNYFYPRL